MSRRQLPPQIKKVDVLDRKSGEHVVRYQVTVDAGENPATGKRQQVRRRYASEKEARKALAEITGGVVAGTFVPRSALTIEQACREWLAGMHNIEPTTRAAYEHALAPLRQRHGALPVQKLTKAHLDQLVTDLKAGAFGRRKVWRANSINPMLNLISRVLSDLVRQGALTRDVAALVKRAKRPAKKLTTFTAEEVRRVLGHVEHDRLGHAWHLALAGLRRGEIGGLLWADIELDDDADAGTVTIAHNRVSVGGRVHDTDPKTARSARTLPLTPALAKVLRRAKVVQAAERLRLGPDYGPGEHVVVDEAGRPYHPDTLSDFWRELCSAAKVTTIRLHDARHSCASLMHAQGVPIAAISAWLGHADPAFTMRTYVHSHDDALKVAAATLQRVVTSS
jgi:integrase